MKEQHQGSWKGGSITAQGRVRAEWGSTATALEQSGATTLEQSRVVYQRLRRRTLMRKKCSTEEEEASKEQAADVGDLMHVACMKQGEKSNQRSKAKQGRHV